MIQTKDDLKRYIRQDMERNHVAVGGAEIGLRSMRTLAYGLHTTYVIMNIIIIESKI